MSSSEEAMDKGRDPGRVRKTHRRSEQVGVGFDGTARGAVVVSAEVAGDSHVAGEEAAHGGVPPVGVEAADTRNTGVGMQKLIAAEYFGFGGILGISHEREHRQYRNKKSEFP